MSRTTVNQLAEMMSKMQNDMQRIADAVQSVDARLTALEEGKAVSTKASKPVTQKSKTSDEPKWVLNKKCIYSVPNAWISKNARYAFKFQAEENGGTTLTKEEREALVKKLGDKYVTARKFATEKAAKEFFAKWMA